MTSIGNKKGEDPGRFDRATSIMPVQQREEPEQRVLLPVDERLHSADPRLQRTAVNLTTQEPIMEATVDLPNKFMEVTGVYQGEIHDPELMLTAAYNLDIQPPQDGLAATIISPQTILRENLEMLDSGFKASVEKKNFFSPKDLNLKDKPEFAHNTALDDLSEFNPRFVDETSVFSEQFDEQLKKVFEKQKGDDSFKFEASNIVQLSKAISRSIDGNNEMVLVPLFNAIFTSKQGIDKAIGFGQNLLTKRLKAKLAIVARDFTKELSVDEQSIFLLHSLIDVPQRQLDGFYKTIFDKALEKIQPDAKYLDPEFFEGQYKEGLRRAIELELGAYKKDFKDSEVIFENGSNPQDKALKVTMAKRLNAFNPLPPILADIAFESSTPSLIHQLRHPISSIRSHRTAADADKEYHNKIVKPLADNLRRYIPRLDEYHQNTQETVAKVYLDSVEALAAAKALQIFKAGKEAALNDKQFFEAIRNKDHKTILSSLKEHFGEDHIQNPLRRFFILSRIAGDSDFTRRIDLAKEERARAFKRSPLIRLGLPTTAVSLLGAAVALGTAGYQDSRDIYGNATAVLDDKVNFDFTPNLKSIEKQFNQSEQWDQRRIFTAEEIIEAGKSELISKTKSPVNYLLSRILPLLENSKDLKDSPIISIDFNDSPREAKEQLLSLMDSKTDLFDNLTKEEKEQIAENYFSAYERMRGQFLSHRPDTPINFIPVSFKDAEGQEKEVIVLDARSIQDCLKPFTDDNPTNLQMPRIFELATSFTSTEANRNFFKHAVSQDHEKPYFKDPIDFMKRGGAKGFPKFVNKLGSEIDQLRQALKLKGLRD